VFISILFNSLGDTIGNAFKNKQILADLTAAAQDPDVLADPNNREFLLSMAQGSDSSALSDQLKTDSSFLSNLDPRLARPFEVGFADSAVQVFVWASVVVAVAFVLSFFVKAPPLRETSASQEVAAASAGH
jgi:hypothetical protein